MSDMKVSSYRCDECGKWVVPNDANGWWVVIRDPAERMIRLIPWQNASQPEIDDPKALHACGRAHAIKTVSFSMGVLSK